MGRSEVTLDGPVGARRRLLLPRRIRACLFDLDGVLTQTARLHESAWKATFDRFLHARSVSTGEPFAPFSSGDYERYVDGRPRLDGVRAFLASRDVSLPDSAVTALADRKNRLVLELMRREGVEAFDGSVRLARAAREAGLRLAVVSASSNCADVLAAAGIDGLFELRVDGVYARERGLAGKPAPDTFLAAAEALGVRPDEAAVFEDALAGVAAARAGGFGLVVGVDRTGQADALRARGADLVVSDLSELLEHE
jgi:beta-phosphoglucomutase family hydrolase